MIKKKLTLISILILIFLVLISAFIIEFALGHEPCKLCIYQRIPYFLSIILIGLIFFIKKLEKITLLTLSLVFFISFVLAFYHFGIEKGYWNGLSKCSKNIDFNNNTLKNILMIDPIKCNDIQFEILNLSLAGWNALVSLLVFMSCMYLMHVIFNDVRLWR